MVRGHALPGREQRQHEVGEVEAPRRDVLDGAGQ